ncbi:phosphotransferase [Microbacterium sp.]|uniref:phosphotransferase n=1 Tax=Microbacterium sp. TaxID=51671 RepID=UPI0025EFD6CE|nr:phosphotransferase [Microbacterium sp.]
MPRSPLTLAASVTSALPRATVIGVGPLTEGVSGRYDSAIATLDDGRRVVVRVPTDREADTDLRAEAHALKALTAGVRGVLPFGAPDVLGETSVDGVHAVVQTLLPGYRVDAVHVPAGEGVATALAVAIAKVHDLPVTVIRDAGLPVLTAVQVRDEAERLLDRAEATGHLPFGLLRRWSTALGSEALWRFETTVTLGGVDPASFVLEDDDDGVPHVTGLLSWGGVGGGDPAVDLRWTASAPDAREAVIDTYTRVSHRAPDRLLLARARLHAELEFAKWLVHGHSTGAESIVADAIELLTALEQSVRDEPPLAHETVTVDDAIAVLGRIRATTGDLGHREMETDAFDAESLASFTTDERDAGGIPTSPIEMSDWAPLRGDTGGAVVAPRDDSDDATDDDPDAAARNALRRWTDTA